MTAVSPQQIGIPAATTRRDRTAVAPAERPLPRRPWFSITFALGLAGAVLMWAAFPPIDWPWLAWIAPVPWLWLVNYEKLPGRWPYAALWLAGFGHWLLMLQGIRLAHPALYAGWIALAAYLGVYLPLFLALTRVAVRRLNTSVNVAAPVVWVGLELLRGHLITGFSMALLAHTQAEFPRLIQISDLAGGYALGFIIMLVAAGITQALAGHFASARTHDFVQRGYPIVRLSRSMLSLAIAGIAIAGTLGYGTWRLMQSPPGKAGPIARVALIQGALDTVFEVSPERAQETYEHYRVLTDQEVALEPNLDLVVWPESAFTQAENLLEEPPKLPPDWPLSVEETRQRMAQLNAPFDDLLAEQAARINRASAGADRRTKLLIGTTSVVHHFAGARVYNSALLADPGGKVVARYYKTHPVMFGEYIPFGDALPWLYRLTPMSGGLSIGGGPSVFPVASLTMSPSICFESTVPHLIRGQLAALARRGTPADCLVNVTNDGWFWGSAILDLHFRCGIFRAVENRKPLLIAANTGISAWIDGNGEVRARGMRRNPQALMADVQADGRPSLYLTMGDLPAWLCAAVCVLLAAAGLSKPRKMPKLP